MGVDVVAGLQVSFVENLDGIISPVVDYLNNAPAGRDLFDIDHIIVPNAGVRAWLLQHIANTVGVTPHKHDGIAAQVDIKYLGALDGFLGRGFADDDPWEVGPLAITVLSVLKSVTDAEILKNVQRLGGGLKAARAIADKFDQYHARRPSMILEWMNSGPNLAPTLSDDFRDGRYVAQPLAAADRWQYDLWKLVFAEIGQDPWAAVVQKYVEQPALLDELTLPPRILVAGVQSLSVRHIRLLQLLARRIEVSVYMVHPSPVLAQSWAGKVADTVPTQVISPTAPKRVEFDDAVDPLVGMWLRGAHDAQQLLASQGVTAQLPVQKPAKGASNLLEALQESVRTGSAAEISFVDTDRSVQMHRAHNLGRQIEILHESLIHTFNEHENLEPHEVVVVCADIEAAAPLLSATFSRTVQSTNGEYVLPLVVADRGLRFVDDGASLLANILTAARGRFSIADVMAVATSPLVLKKLGAGSDDIESWYRIIERTRIRWGASQDQRARMGVDIHEDAHTWLAGLQRALTGALLPDSPLQSNFGDVVPLADLEAAEVETVASLARIVTVLAELETKAKGSQGLTVIEWAEAVEEALTSLGADARGELDNAREVIQTLQKYVTKAAGAHVDAAVCTFNDFADLLDELIAGTPGRQPLRTGAITATSMVPLRSVPFKVVCLVGFDEGTMRAGDAEGDDLVSRQDFVGDSNARIDQRRAILDAIVAAELQVIITCNGRSIKDNTEVPLITPLSELLDLCERCGVEQKKNQDGNHLEIEYQHPRHFGAAKNFIEGKIVPGIVWSHDEVGLAALSNTVTITDARKKAEEVSKEIEKNKKSTKAEFVSVSVSDLRYFISNPLRAFVRDTLDIHTWKDEETDEPAEIPLIADKREASALRKSLVSAMKEKMSPQNWAVLQHKIGTLPFGKYGDELVSDVTERVKEANTLAKAWGADLSTATTKDILLKFKNCELSGSVRYFPTENNRIAVYEYDAEQDGPMSKERVALDLLMLAASGETMTEAVLLFHDSDKKSTVAHFVVIDPDFTKSKALKKLESLVQCYLDASIAPYPMYGKTAEKVVFGKDKEDVAAFIAANVRLRAEEKLIYGPLAKFDEVYTKPVRQFFERYFEACPQQNDDRARDLSPKVDKKTGKKILENEKAPNDAAVKSKKYLYQ
jgi:exodeoxyribonuclease V gamma subunit